MFLEKDNRILNLNLLKNLFKINKIKYSQLTKKQLIDKFNKTICVKIIQRCFRKYFYRNAIDHISLDPIAFPCFIYHTKFKINYFYSFDNLIKYIMKTGDTRDPMTRTGYTDAELIRLDTQAKMYFPEKGYRSTLKIKKSLNYARRIRNIENEILSFQMRLDELKENIISIFSEKIYLWNITNFVVDTVEYISIQSYIDNILHELKLTLLNLRDYDSYSAELFKSNLINILPETDIHEKEIKQYINLI